MSQRMIFVLAATLALAPSSAAQGRGRIVMPNHPATGNRGAHLSGTHFRHHRSAYPTGYFLGGLPFYDEYLPESAAAEPEPHSLPVQTPATESSAGPKAKPLLIELQGDRYVRYGGVAEPAGQDGTEGARTVEASARVYSARDRSRELIPAVLIFRDGHREQVKDYAIVGRVLYTQDDNHGASYGVRNVQISALDLAATMAANRENGITFVLPAGPNEVVTRP